MTTGRHRAAGTAGRHRAALIPGLRWYVVDRGFVPAFSAVLAVTVAVTAIAVVPRLRQFLEESWIPIASMGPLLAVVFMMRTLSGDDVRLEQSVPRLRPRWRLAHAVIAVALSAALMLVAASTRLREYEVLELVRNVCGLSGLALLSTPMLSAASAWTPTAGYTLFTLMTVPRDSGVLSGLFGWHLQSSARSPSWLTAALLLTVGTAVYVRRGPSP